MRFNNRLRQIRKVKGFSQQYVADSIGISRVAYYKIESGKTIPRYDTALKLHKFLNMPFLWLFPM